MKEIKLFEQPSMSGERHPTVFLAGGIVGCPDWQNQVMQGLSDLRILFFNPRHDKDGKDIHFNSKVDQWVENWIIRTGLVAFWFCKETTQHKWIFQLGRMSDKVKPIIVGLHPDYKFAQDIQNLFILSRVRARLVYNIEDLIDKIRQFFW